MSRWFRHYAGMCADPKFGGIARRAKVGRDRVVFVFSCILESASERNNGGSYEWDADAVADLLNCETDEIQRVHAELEASGLVEAGHISSWAKRQFESDKDATAAERQRRFRDKSKAVTPVTDVSRVTNAPHSTETDTDTEKKERNAREARLAVSKEFSEQFWPAFPNKVGKPAAERAFYAARKRGCDLDRIMAGLDRYIRAKPPDRPWMNPATFLNQERFEDEPAAATVLPFSTPPPKEEYSEAEKARRLKEWKERGFYEATK